MSEPSESAMKAADEIAHMRHRLHEEGLREAIPMIAPIIDCAMAEERAAADAMAKAIKLVFDEPETDAGWELMQNALATYEKARAK